MLTITFISLPAVDDTISFKYYANWPTELTEFTRSGHFEITRVNPGEISIGTDINDQAALFASAFEADYGTSFSIIVLGNVVTIEALNGSNIFDFTFSGSFITYELTQKNNVIHVINFTPRKYAIPAILGRDYLITEDNDLIITEDGKKIRL